MKESKKEEAAIKQTSREKTESFDQENETGTPASSEQINQNFRQNSGNNSEDIKTAPDGLSDYH